MAISTLKTAVGQLSGLLLGAVAVKLLAVLAGPSGVGLYSVLRHLQQMLSSIASIGGQNAIVQGLSRHEGKARQQFLLSSFYVFVGGSLLLSAAILIFADYIALWVFSGNHVSAIRWLVIPIVLGAMLFFFRGVLTAELQFGSLSMINLLTGLGAVVVALPVGQAYSHGYSDMLVLLVGGGLAPALTAALIYVRRLGYLCGATALALGNVTRGATVRFFGVALPSLLSLLLTLGSVLVVRAYIVNLYGLEGAGHFDAAWSISAMYLALFLASLQSYLLPEVSQVETTGKVLHAALAKAFHFALLLALPLIVSLLVLKPLVVQVLFNKAFLPSLDMLRWILLGDFVRVLGWIISTTLIARADMKGFTLAEGLWSLVFVLLSLCLLPKGIEWVGLAYVVSYTLYLAFLARRLRQAHGASLQSSGLLRWLIGFAFVVFSAWLCWSDRSVYSWHILLIAPAALFSFFIMRTDERIFARQLLARLLHRLERLTGRR